MSNVHLIEHPLVQHKLTLMRKKEASTNSFRRLLNELAMLMAYEVTRDMPMQEVEIETPLEKTRAKVIDGKKLVFVSILRAGHRHPGRHAERGAGRARRPHRPVPRPRRR
jgi:uracil phosphoribosyltransferase